MNNERCLIVYFSHSGYTKKLARELSRNIKCDIEEIKTDISYNGILGYQRALFHALFNRSPEIKKLKHNPIDYNLVIVGGPVWAGSIAAPVRSFLKNYKDQLKNVAFFITQGGHLKNIQAFDQMKQASGKTSLANLSVIDREILDEALTQKVSNFINGLNLQNVFPIREKMPKSEQRLSNEHLM